jgi:hypothetical protein
MALARLSGSFLLLLVILTPATAQESEDIHVTVYLRTTAKIDGIVRGGFERLSGGSFQPATIDDGPNVGYRIWYTSGTNGFIFVRHRDIVRIENRGVVTDEQRRRLEETLRQLREAAQRSREEARLQLEGLRERQEAEEKAEEETGQDEVAQRAKVEEEEAARKREALLERFPPTEWKPERRDQIRQNQVILGLAPSPRENEWLESYDSWKPAYDEWVRLQKQKEEETPEGETPETPAPSGESGGESSRP